MGKVIQLFKHPPPDESDKEWEFELSEDLITSIANVTSSIDEIWATPDPDRVRQELRRIKAEIRRWPSE